MNNPSTSADGRGAVPLHPIGVVARRTGLSVHVLRAWERRYGAIEPHRSAGGQRLYTDGDVARIRLLRQATEAGHNIGQIASLGRDALLALVRPESPPPPDIRPVDQPAGTTLEERFVAPALAAAERLDAARLQTLLLRAVVELRPGDFAEGVVVPLLHATGERWACGTLDPYQEHAVSVAVRRVLHWVMELWEPEGAAPTLVAGTLEGELHEFGALLAAVVAAEAGWRVVYLGPSLPPEQIAAAARTAGARAVGLSVVHPGDVPATEEAFARLARELPASTRLLVGGRAVPDVARAAADAGARHTPGLRDLRQVLRTLGRAAEETPA